MPFGGRCPWGIPGQWVGNVATKLAFLVMAPQRVTSANEWFPLRRDMGENVGMARNTIVEILDDLDGSKNAQEITFSFQGVDYTIDLAKKNLAAFEKAIAPYLEAASKVSKTRSGGKRAPSKSTADRAAIREWAKTVGLAVSERGRIAQGVIDQYNAANK